MATDKIPDSDFLSDYVRRLHDATALSDERLGWFGAAREIWCETRAAGGRVVFVGNGGSAAIASEFRLFVSAMQVRSPALPTTTDSKTGSLKHFSSIAGLQILWWQSALPDARRIYSTRLQRPAGSR
jgi:hypothetical protein